MTDMENMEELLESFGIGFFRWNKADGSGKAITCMEGADNVTGVPYCLALFHFTQEGESINLELL